MGGLYVKSLMAIFKDLGIEQNTVVKRLGSTATQVSLWAHGVRPVARKHEAPLLAWVRDLLKSAPERHYWGLYQRLCAWHEEMAYRRGVMVAQVDAARRAIARDQFLDREKMSEMQVLGLIWHARQILDAEAALARVQGRPEDLVLIRGDVSQGFVPEGKLPTLVEMFVDVCRHWCVPIDAA